MFVQYENKECCFDLFHHPHQSFANHCKSFVKQTQTDDETKIYLVYIVLYTIKQKLHILRKLVNSLLYLLESLKCTLDLRSGWKLLARRRSDHTNERRASNDDRLTGVAFIDGLYFKHSRNTTVTLDFHPALRVLAISTLITVGIRGNDHIIPENAFSRALIQSTNELRERRSNYPTAIRSFESVFFTRSTSRKGQMKYV